MLVELTQLASKEKVDVALTHAWMIYNRKVGLGEDATTHGVIVNVTGQAVEVVETREQIHEIVVSTYQRASLMGAKV